MFAPLILLVLAYIGETELPRGYVVRRMVQGQSHVTEADVANFVKESLADHKRLRGGVIFVDEIPRSASGKILRKNLRTTGSDEPKAKM